MTIYDIYVREIKEQQDQTVGGFAALFVSATNQDSKQIAFIFL